ncbi:MAG TPA: amino acid adenylation domain-containing protein [Candidatus Angelobacter sp.]|jgi:amino acid adenylation domain-containing protein
MKTLVDVLRYRAQEQPHSDVYVHLLDDDAGEVRLNYEQLDRKARRIAAYLQSVGLQGQRVLLLYPAGLEFVCAFMGCLYAGAVAVPAHPPGHARSAKRVQNLMADCSPALVLTTIASKAREREACEAVMGSLRVVQTESLNPALESCWHPGELTRDGLAFLQYTSGSTTAPKGVMITHDNLMHTESLIQNAFCQTPESVVVSWLPFHHDMGLIGGVLQPMFTGGRCILMSPMQFLQQPVRWLQTISSYRATTSGGPNFAYDYCLHKITREERKNLDLSCWKVAFNGAEHVRSATIDNFAREFAECGFRKEAFQPCYGLAEATLLVSGFKKESGVPQLRTFDTHELQRNKAVSRPLDSGKVTRLASSGRTSRLDRVLIVDPESFMQCRDRTIGEIWISGPGVAMGYWQKQAETEAVFGARLGNDHNTSFLRTGDLGFFNKGELFITGRLKDLIIIRGVNYFPQDIEETVVECHPSLRSGGGAAFAITDDSQTERLVIVQEAEKRPGMDFGALIDEIRAAVTRSHDLAAHAIVLVRTGTIPKTSSGKIRRNACRDAFLKDELSVVAEWRHAGESAAPQLAIPRNALASPDGARVWLVNELAHLLGLDPAIIDSQRPAWEYGIDSLTAYEMTHRLEALGKVLPATTFLGNEAIASIASKIVDAPWAEAGQSAALEGAPSQHPVSYGQRVLWFLQHMRPENSAYNLSIAALVHGVLDRMALRRTLNRLVRRHSSLRSTFGQRDNQLMQFVHDVLEPSFIEHDAASWDSETLHVCMAREMNSPLDLEAGPLLRVVIYDRGNEKLVLQVTAHHLVADFWSLAVALEELGRFYAVETGVAADPQFAPAPAYSEFVRWEAAMLSGPEGERLWNYWQQCTAGELPVCTLPTDRPRGVTRGYAGKKERARFDRGLAADLKRLAREHGCTLFTVLLAAFDVLLFRYTDCDDILIGSPAMTRTSAGFARLIGYCANPLLLRTRISASWSFTELLETVRNIVTGALLHQQYPYPLLVERLHPQRTSDGAALFHMMFTFLGKMTGYSGEAVSLAMGEPGSRTKLHDLELEPIPFDDSPIEFDLNLVVGDGVEVGVALHYNTDLFDSSTIARVLTHWQAILRWMLRAPESPLSSFQLLSHAETAELMTIGDGVHASYPADVCLHELIEAMVEQVPERIALVFGNQHITYDFMNGRANQLAHHLRLLGAGRDVPVGICVGRSSEMVVALLAILKSGSAYVPLDPGYPEDRLTYMLEDAGVSLIVTNRQMMDRLSWSQAARICLDDDADSILARPTSNLAPMGTPENMAYVIYTSGSTGRPKGVVIPHRSVVNFFAMMTGALGRDPGAWLAVTSISFDISVLELLWTLTCGFEVAIFADQRAVGRRDETAGLVSLEPLLARISHLQCTPSLLKILVAETQFANIVSNLDKLLVGGEAVSPRLLETLPLGQDTELYNMYGPTETTIWSAMERLHVPATEVLLGRPVANTQIHILDRFQNPLPVGLPGELCIGGEGLARGYLGMPDLTAARFIPDPLGNAHGARLYRTGDRARWKQNGKLEFLGRMDFQVKVRGYRIEFGEIEACLARHPAIKDVVLSAFQDAGSDTSLAAYVVLHPGLTPSIQELREFISARLPDYMIPSAFVTLSELPMMPNGKVDRKRLPGMNLAQIRLDEAYVAPTNALERLMADLWSELLNMERVSIHSNFFALGGHSLMANTLVSRLRDLLQVELSLKTFFANPTVASVSQVLLRDHGEQLERTAEILDVITRLPEEEAEALLRGEAGPPILKSMSSESPV